MPPWSPTAQNRTSNSSGGTSRTSGRQPKWDSRYPCSEFERPVIGAPPLLQTASVPWHADGLDSAYDQLGFGRKNGLYLPSRPNHDACHFFLFTSANVSALSLSRPFRIPFSLHRSHHIVLLSMIR